MRVLFVSSGRGGNVSIIVKNQGESLKTAGVKVEYFPIRGGGLSGYLKSVPLLRKTIIRGNYDIVHAHYSASALVTTLAGGTHKVVSLMGSDVYNGHLIKFLIKGCGKKMWDATVVKTRRMYELLGLKNAFIIPNGVDMECFRPEDKQAVRARLNIPETSKIVLFVSTHDRPEKNISLAYRAVSLLKEEGIELMYLKGVDHGVIPDYLNASDILLLTSLYEGSPNIVKEAMACNCPVVSTDVGDVKELIEGVEGCYLTSFEPADIAAKIRQAVSLGKRTEGRQRLISLGLDAPTVALKLVELYKSVIKQ